MKYTGMGLVLSAIGSALSVVGLGAAQLFPLSDPILLYSVSGGLFLVYLILWMTGIKKIFFSRFRKRHMKDLDSLTPLESQTRRDSWDSIRVFAAKYLEKTGGFFSLRDLRSEYSSVLRVFESGAREIREALNELAALDHDDTVEIDKWIANQSNLLRKTGEKL